MFTKRARLWLGLIAALAVLSLGSSCGNKTTTTEITSARAMNV